MNQKQIRGSEIASAARLAELEKQYRRSGQKKYILLSIPVLWLAGAGVAYLIDSVWGWEALVGWCLLVAFMSGVYLLYRVPAAADVVHKYSLEILPGLFKQLGTDQVRVARRHDLSMKVFLEAGLYYDKYASVLREDCVQGALPGMTFGMYEIAVQVDTGIYIPVIGKTEVKTNQFYGWFIVAEPVRINGFHFITLRKRIHTGESDDWHEKTVSHWENDTTLQQIKTGNREFDETFLLNTDQPAALRELLDSPAQELLLYLARTAKNAFAISIQRTAVYMMIGHETAEFRVAPEKDFTGSVPEKLVADVQWYMHALNGFRKMAVLKTIK